MNKNKIKTTARRTAALLAALTIAPPLMGAVVQNTSTVSWGTSTAQAQPRWGDPDWAKNRNSRRATHYRDSDLSRLSWITVRGEVTDDPERDYFEFRSNNGDRFRVLTRPDVSLRGIDDDDRVEVYGKRDGDVIIAYRVNKLRDDDDNDDKRFRATVANNLPGNRFTIRHRNRTTTVVAERGEPYGLRAGSEVTLEGIWRGDTFHASSVRLRDDDRDDNWQDGQNRKIRGTAVTSLSNSKFTMRIDRGRTVEVTTKGSSIRNISRGDRIEVWGRWDRGDNEFKGSSATIITDYNDRDDDFRDGRRVEFEGRVTKASRQFGSWFYTVRTDRGRDVNVRYNRQFYVGDRVEVEGTMQNNVVNATDMDRDN